MRQIMHSEDETLVTILRITVEEGSEGLLYATSPDLKGLLVSSETLEDLRAEIPKVIAALIEERYGRKVKVVPARSYADTAAGHNETWAAIPPAHMLEAARAC